MQNVQYMCLLVMRKRSTEAGKAETFSRATLARLFRRATRELGALSLVGGAIAGVI